jgi:hypothetical protein
MAGKNRPVMLMIYVNRDEKRTIERLAKVEGLSQTALARNLLLNRAQEKGLWPITATNGKGEANAVSGSE